MRLLDADPLLGYAPLVRHGIVGKGLIDFDSIFEILRGVDFDGWISIEDGQDPTEVMAHLHASAEFLQRKLLEHGLATKNGH